MMYMNSDSILYVLQTTCIVSTNKHLNTKKHREKMFHEDLRKEVFVVEGRFVEGSVWSNSFHSKNPVYYIAYLLFITHLYLSKDQFCIRPISE